MNAIRFFCSVGYAQFIFIIIILYLSLFLGVSALPTSFFSSFSTKCRLAQSINYFLRLPLQTSTFIFISPVVTCVPSSLITWLPTQTFPLIIYVIGTGFRILLYYSSQEAHHCIVMKLIVNSHGFVALLFDH
jgi:hypothetical protein